MTSTREKGNAFQVWIRKYLEERGWVVRNFPCTTRPLFLPDPKDPKKKKTVFVRQSNDVFGCDLVARGSGLVRWIQATLDTGKQKRAEEFSKFWKFTLRGESVELWMKKAGGEVEISEWSPVAGKFKPLGRIKKGMFYPDEEIEETL